MIDVQYTINAIKITAVNLIDKLKCFINYKKKRKKKEIQVVYSIMIDRQTDRLYMIIKFT